MHEHWNEFIALYPRTDCLETPITDPVKTKHRHEYSWGVNEYTTTEFEKVDNA
tara:strand:- start:618 stop:776 length:159 start_codon:yes stop_codon:yes gene_type:complete